MNFSIFLLLLITAFCSDVQIISTLSNVASDFFYIGPSGTEDGDCGEKDKKPCNSLETAIKNHANAFKFVYQEGVTVESSAIINSLYSIFDIKIFFFLFFF